MIADKIIKSTDIQIKYLSDCEQHIEKLAALQFEEISKHWVPGASIEATKNKLIAHANKDKLPLTLVALFEDKPIGMASLRINDGIRFDLVPWLGSLVVHPRFRGAKVGELLIETIKKKALSFGYSMLYLLAFDTTIPDWYSRLGWKTIGMDKLFNHPVTVMEIELFNH